MPRFLGPDAYRDNADRGIARHTAQLPAHPPREPAMRSNAAANSADEDTAGTSRLGAAAATTRGGAERHSQTQRKVPEDAPVVHKADTVWAIEQGALSFQVELGQPEEQMSPASSVQNPGKDCWGHCRGAGLCAWCGSGNACCRRNTPTDPPVCRTGKDFVRTGHECVAVSSTTYMHSKVTLSYNGNVVLSSPLKGLWSVGRDLQKGWPSTWDYAGIGMIDVVGPFIVVEGSVQTPKGAWVVKDRWRIYDGVLEGLRTWIWSGAQKTDGSVLSIGWTAQGKGAGLLMPGVLYHGNPSGQKAMKRGSALVPSWNGMDGDRLQVEEHRLAQTWASLEFSSSSSTDPSEDHMVVALESQASAPPYGLDSDLAWTLGAEVVPNGTVLQLLSGPVALNGKTGIMKTGQSRRSSYEKVAIKVPPGGTIQKIYRLHAGGPVQKGTGFQVPLHWVISRGDLSAETMPHFADIVKAKVRFAVSRWAGKNPFPGFAMYPGNMNLYVMGWAGQAEAPGYALQVLADRLGQPELRSNAHKALDVLARAKFNGNGFMLQVDGRSGMWSGQDPVSQGQAMSAFARAIRYGRKTDADTESWEKFLRKALKIHAARILKDNQWHPRSTAEAFIIQPLAIGSKLFDNDEFLKAALKAGEHYLKRHIGLKEPFWGGTLDASCEDKEGAWAGFEAFLALYEATDDDKWLTAASYAADMTLTYTYTWDVNLPPGRLRDHNLRTRGWTAVSVQNMHLDVYGVLYTPRLWRLGELTNRPELLRLAELMYRTCGQMIDEHGSQGEQLQQTRFAQAGDQTNPDHFRGGYVESWTVFWIAAHFLTAAAQFEEMGVLSELWDRI